jgi:hypothetical protein
VAALIGAGAHVHAACEAFKPPIDAVCANRQWDRVRVLVRHGAADRNFADALRVAAACCPDVDLVLEMVRAARPEDLEDTAPLMQAASPSNALALAAELGMDAACRGQEDAVAQCRFEAGGDCAVCLREGVTLATRAFKCKHGFCGPCLAKWHGACPCCRQERV